MEFQSGDKIYFTPDYGSTGHLARIVEVYEDSNEYLVEMELKYWMIEECAEDDNGYGFETQLQKVPAGHVYSRDMLEDW